MWAVLCLAERGGRGAVWGIGAARKEGLERDRPAMPATFPTCTRYMHVFDLSLSTVTAPVRIEMISQRGPSGGEHWPSSWGRAGDKGTSDACAPHVVPCGPIVQVLE